MWADLYSQEDLQPGMITSDCQIAKQWQQPMFPWKILPVRSTQTERTVERKLWTTAWNWQIDSI